jgi:hypothetical protein
MPPSRCGYLPTEKASLEYRVLVDVTAAQHDALLLCEFARKKENPSLERYIEPPYALFVVY